eukprot:gnl/Dysnectes_brevis/5042_a7074_685.p1 GENE.gnl/Dysnectes_brevis/5042_a7074_685~~gnl/Dysnectes_brevis/5042_a7074_685.p1  ORF type:complete len:113 (+),score=0.40 gnl/Dysnectes_brevis/5042_a7074_685:62-400(+)
MNLAEQIFIAFYIALALVFIFCVLELMGVCKTLSRFVGSNDYEKSETYVKALKQLTLDEENKKGDNPKKRSQLLLLSPQDEISQVGSDISISDSPSPVARQKRRVLTIKDDN